MSLLRMELDIFIAICDEVGTPLAYKAGLSARRMDWEALASIEVKPSTYTCPLTLLGDSQVSAFLKKHPALPLGLDRKAKARELFWEAESQCFQANQRLSRLLLDREAYGTRIGQFVSTWRKKVARILRSAPSWDSLTNDIRFGPGSTFLNTGPYVQMAYKLSDGYTRTELIEPALKPWRETVWSRYAANGYQGVPADFGGTLDWCSTEHDAHFAQRDFEVIRGNRFTTVPKDAKKDRGICVEPSLNVAYQLAIGGEISRRLKRSLGWDKRTAQDYHRTLARIGSLTGAIATIDLSMASDTVCSNLVRLLLPDDWCDLVFRTRSSHTRLDGKWVLLEKFSSMGNGFTFELETLLFWTLALTVQDLEGIMTDPYTPGLATSVFGDDMVVPSCTANSTVAALKFFGFKPNEEKTFLTGRFRESCGGDFLNGYDVRPVFLKTELKEPHELIALANGLYRIGDRFGAIYHSRNFIRPWFKVLDFIPSDIRCLRGPPELGDLVITDAQWRQRGQVTVRESRRYVRVWRPVRYQETEFEQLRPGVLHALALFHCRGGTAKDYISRRVVTGPIGSEGGLALCLSLLNDEAPRSVTGIPTRVNGSYVSGFRRGRVQFS